MKRKQLRVKDAKKLLEQYNPELSQKDKIELLDDKLFVINNLVSFFYYEKKLAPTLRYLLVHPDKLKKIVVDMGAIKFLVGGADIMRPGIVKIADDINKDDFIAAFDEKNDKPIIIGIALFNAKEMQEKTSGKVIKNIHYIGDKLWNTT